MMRPQVILGDAARSQKRATVNGTRENKLFRWMMEEFFFYVIEVLKRLEGVRCERKLMMSILIFFFLFWL